MGEGSGTEEQRWRREFISGGREAQSKLGLEEDGTSYGGPG